MTFKATEMLDAVAKLIAASAVVAATLVANRYQSSMAASNLLSQREQADSTLRAGMFHDLIGPVAGSQGGNGNMSVEREKLLVELLALNFHEHFELKPLMVHVDDRLAHENIPEMTQSQRNDARYSLRSSAHRVMQRQLAMLTKSERNSAPESCACVSRLDIMERPQQPVKQVAQAPKPCSAIANYFGDLISVTSPNGLYTLAFIIAKPKNWDDQSFDVSMRITSKNGGDLSPVSADQDFQLTWFDFPYIDNTLLADGTRFSLVIDQVKDSTKKAIFKLVWFPQDYFSARERPTNYQQLREKLGLKIK